MLADVQERLERACERARRDPASVTLVAVTKGHGVTEIERQVLAHGHRILAENRVQEWREKAAKLEGVEWHFIGNLQRNKVKYLTPVRLIHSLASERLAEALELEGAKRDHVFAVLIEVNVAGEAAKQGVPLTEAAALVRYARSLPHLAVRGLMTMAPYADDPEASRPIFRRLRDLRDTLGDTLALKELSMGMSGDFEVAVEEGATLVRVGSAVFAKES